MPRLATHIDDETGATLAAYCATFLTKREIILDLMSSSVSHLARNSAFRRAIGHGINRAELQTNQQLDEYLLQNLNKTPAQPFKAASFDACLTVLSLQYLTKPVEVFSETTRILKPSGVLTALFSNPVCLLRGLPFGRHWATTRSVSWFLNIHTTPAGLTNPSYGTCRRTRKVAIRFAPSTYAQQHVTYVVPSQISA